MSPDRLTLIVGLLTAMSLLVGLSATMLLREARRRDLESRVAFVVGDSASARLASSGLISVLKSVGERIRRGTKFYSQKDIENLESLLLAAGLDPQRYLPVLLALKFAMMIALPVIAAIVGPFVSGSGSIRAIIILVGVVSGILGPEMILNMLRRAYHEALERGAPDALDLLVVCSEAGMGLESALERVSSEMYRSNRPTASALSGLLDDLRVLPDRRVAFSNFGRRSGVEGLQRLSTMLGQSLQYGTPLSQALRAVAGELRRHRINVLEEKAVKLPAKLIFPLIFFIMPSLYIVLLGTSFLRLYDMLGAFALPTTPVGG
jgi:tight adherence protein C